MPLFPVKLPPVNCSLGYVLKIPSTASRAGRSSTWRFEGIHGAARGARPPQADRPLRDRARRAGLHGQRSDRLPRDEHALLATHANGEPLAARARLAAPPRHPRQVLLEEREVAPRRSSCSPTDKPGFWERYGYITTPTRSRKRYGFGPRGSPGRAGRRLHHRPPSRLGDCPGSGGDIRCRIARSVGRAPGSSSAAERGQPARGSPGARRSSRSASTTGERSAAEHGVTGHDQGARALVEADRAGGVAGQMQDVEREPAECGSRSPSEKLEVRRPRGVQASSASLRRGAASLRRASARRATRSGNAAAPPACPACSCVTTT